MGLNRKHVINLEYFRSFVHSEYFITWGRSLKKQQVTYLQLFAYF